MPTSKRNNGWLLPVLKKAATVLTTTGFFAAAVFLALILWLPGNDAPASTAVDVQPSLLLALDKPERPAPKVHLRELLSLTDEEVEMAANLPSPDLATELNSWTYTQGALEATSLIELLYIGYVLQDRHNIPIFNAFATFQFEFFSGLLKTLESLHNPLFASLEFWLQNFALPTLSPYR